MVKVGALALAVAIAPGCKTDDPDYCASSNTCALRDDGRTYCDIKGELGPGHTCQKPGFDAALDAEYERPKPLDVPTEMPDAGPD